jgi:hypothetical protein
MSKKAKRMRAIQQASKKTVVVNSEKPVLQVNTAIKPAAVQNTKNAAAAAAQEAQYKYIMPELIRISVIAIVFFAAIIVLSFIIK